MMTAAQVARDISAIHARVRRDDVLDPRPVTLKWAPVVPFVALANTETSRGHRMVATDQCKACKALKPTRGGWDKACDHVTAKRNFKGDNG